MIAPAIFIANKHFWRRLPDGRCEQIVAQWGAHAGGYWAAEGKGRKREARP